MNWPGALLPGQGEALADLLDELCGEPPPMLVGAAAVRVHVPMDERLQHSRDVDVAEVVSSWEALGPLLRALSPRFEVDVAELRLLHRTTRHPVDLVPYGPLETRPGQVENPTSKRRIITLGVAEARQHGHSVQHGRGRIILPTPEHLLMLKLVAWFDRRAPKDVEDAGRLLRALVKDEVSALDDPAIGDAMADGVVTWGELAVWQAGRRLRSTCEVGTTAHVVTVLNQLLAEPPAMRRRLVRAQLDLDEAVAEADRQLEALRDGLVREDTPRE